MAPPTWSAASLALASPNKYDYLLTEVISRKIQWSCFLRREKEQPERKPRFSPRALRKNREVLSQYCGSLAQLVEQRPEEPCVPSSSLGGATKVIAPSTDGAITLAGLCPGLELEVRTAKSRTEACFEHGCSLLCREATGPGRSHQRKYLRQC